MTTSTHSIFISQPSVGEDEYKALEETLLSGWITQGPKVKQFEDDFSLIVKLPLNIVQFNQDIIDLCKKHEFKKNSLIKIRNYILDKNERVLKKNDTTLKVTEKEVIFLETLYSSKKPLSRDYILKNIWEYSSDTDTHTVETHIYRLRQKIKSHLTIVIL